MAAARSIFGLLAAAYYVHPIIASRSWSGHPELQTISKSFHAAGRTPGTVTFSILPDPDPARYGVPLLGYPNWNETIGFPTAHGTVSSPNSLGYSSIYGWIQFIAFSNTTLHDTDPKWMIDLVPAVSTLNNPFTWYGPEASLFDGPFNLETEKLDWSARSFLAYLPDPAHSRTVVPLQCFEWGFWIVDGRPVVKELKSLELDVWNDHLGLLSNDFTGWNFTRVERHASLH